jgi:hypothetical protein
MRSLAFTALVGSFIASTLAGQSLTEHAAAAAGATIGTAAGKPLGTTLGKIFGDVDKTTSTASGTKAKPSPVKAAPGNTGAHGAAAPAGSATVVAPSAAVPAGTEHPATVVIAGGGGGDEGAAGGGSGHAVGGRGDSIASSRRSTHRREIPVESAPVAVPVQPIVAAAPVTEVLVRELSPQDFAGIHVGTPASEVRAGQHPWRRWPSARDLPVLGQRRAGGNRSAG